MPNPDQLWDDVSRLESLYNELGWDNDDDLRFTIDSDSLSGEPSIVILNHTRWATKFNKQINSQDAIHPQDR